ncbi:MAG: hypothetical protein LJF04_18470 [Gemmatimonadetes bacterium]|nr:hypothetical protein [Gemmatimonadota bacterium]
MIHRASQYRLAAILLSLAAAPAASPAVCAAQVPERWNDARVMALVNRARELRASTVVDTAMRSYRSDAHGYVYFFIDRQDTGQRTLVKADQIALDVYWRAPNQTRQRIVGLRDRKMLPTNIHYHLDHLTVVQDDFGSYIRIGDGDEVSAVLHPLGPGASAVYDYRLADSLSLTYGDGADEVRVYEVRVRPKDPARPGFIGSVYLDRETAAIVRMSFTFTPASYVDSYLDYIRISLDNSRWLGRFWLPYRQEVELRREMPILDFMAGSVIRGRFEIGNYRFNLRLPPTLFVGPRVTAAPPGQRQAFPFQRGLFDDLDQGGLAPTPTLQDIRAEARRIVAQHALSGLKPVRLYLRSFSDALRYDRAEGLRLGAGLELHPRPDASLRASAGYAFGRRKPSAEATVTGEGPRVTSTVDVYWDALRDIGPIPAEVRALNTLSGIVGGEDHLDPYFARGMRLTLAGHDPARSPSVSLRWEDQRSARRVTSGDAREVRPVDEGFLGAAEIAVPLALPGAGTAALAGGVGRLEDRTFATARVAADWALRSGDHSWVLDLDAHGGAVTHEAPAQALFLLGGRATLPGYPFRSFVGDAFGLVRAEGTLPLRPPWVGIRGIAALGYTHLSSTRTLPLGWDAHETDGLRPSVGMGLSLAWDVLRLDLGRGLRGGGWELTFSVDPRFGPWL